MLNNLVYLAGKFGKILDFSQRLEIAIDVAHGLTYLHLYAGELLSAIIITYMDTSSMGCTLFDSMWAFFLSLGDLMLDDHVVYL